jgi:hypothetical protein
MKINNNNNNNNVVLLSQQQSECGPIKRSIMGDRLGE